MNLKFGGAELENRPRAKRYMRRRAGVTRPVAGAPRIEHALEPAPGETLSLGVEANNLTERELLLKSEMKEFW